MFDENVSITGSKETFNKLTQPHELENARSYIKKLICSYLHKQLI